MRHIVLTFASLLLLVTSVNFYPRPQLTLEQHLESSVGDYFNKLFVLMAIVKLPCSGASPLTSLYALNPDSIACKETFFLVYPNEPLYNQIQEYMTFNDRLREILGFLDNFGKEHEIDWNNLVLEDISLDLDDFFAPVDFAIYPLPLNGRLIVCLEDRFFSAQFSIVKEKSSYHLIAINSMN